MASCACECEIKGCTSCCYCGRSFTGSLAARAAELEQFKQHYSGVVAVLNNTIRDRDATIDTLRKQLAVAVSALDFYASKTMYSGIVHNGPTEVSMDNGKRARQALEQIGGG